MDELVCNTIFYYHLSPAEVLARIQKTTTTTAGQRGHGGMVNTVPSELSKYLSSLHENVNALLLQLGK